MLSSTNEYLKRFRGEIRKTSTLFGLSELVKTSDVFNTYKE